MARYYFPEIYPDEILYSALGRFHTCVGSGSRRATSVALFGHLGRATSLELPRNVSSIYDRWVKGRGLTFEEFANGTTLLPYYLDFSSSEIRASSLSAVWSNSDYLHLRLGLSGYGVSRPSSMRFCSACHHSMDSMFGERYWRRAHQLPGVLVCVEHALPLRCSSVGLPLTGRYDYHVVDDDTCPPDAPAVFDPKDDSLAKLLAEIADVSVEILKQPPPPRTLEEAALELRTRAEKAGYRRPGSTLLLARLTDAFMAEYGSALPFLGIRRPDVGRSNWLREMLPPQRSQVHPLQHIVMRCFLAKEERRSGSRIRRSPPEFGEGPWPCHNPLCPDVGRSVIINAKWHLQKRRVVGKFSCLCGYTYTLSIQPTGELGPPRFRAFGPPLQALLRKWIADGLSCFSIGRRMGLSARTVERAARLMGVAVPTSSRKRKAAASLSELG